MHRFLVPLLVVLTMLWLAPVPTSADDQLKPHRLNIPARPGAQAMTVTLYVRDGFDISVFARAPGTLRVMAEAPTGEILVSDMIGGAILRLADRDGDGRAESITTLMTGLNVPHGLAFVGNALYVAETHQIQRMEPWTDPASARVIAQLPTANDDGGHPNHKTRTLAVGPDDKLYVSIGSFCDACVEVNPMRGVIWRFNLDGTGGEQYASGLRNAVGMAFEPGTDRLWVTENGSNALGEDLPPDEINILERLGDDFGWPYCYGAREVQPPLGTPERCAGTVPAARNLPAHIAPLGLTFASGQRFPAEYASDLFVAVHGSALREQAVGYSLLHIPVVDGQPQPPTEFIRGWLVGDDSWGRPMQPLFIRDGSMLLSDDKAGVIYRIRPSS
jgi:glucose/arabinose dehydrogenase